MGHNLAKLAAEGRAFSAGRPFDQDELDAVIAISGLGVSRKNAAEFVRNGIMSVEDYEVAMEKGFKPKSQEEAAAEAEEKLKGRGEAAIKSKAKPKAKPKAK